MEQCDEQTAFINPADFPEIMDLWFELMDAEFTEDEAFDLIELVMGKNWSHHPC